LRSTTCLPLRVADRTVGALTLATGESGRRYGAADYRLAEHFARRVATAVDNARLYREIAEADRRKSEFLALMAHELRNPLAPMRNAVEILRLSDDPIAREQMRSLLERQLGHMVRLIDDLVDLARVERNKIVLRLESVDVTAVVHRAIDVHRSTLARRDQTLVEAMPPTSIIVRADATRLEQIVSNLLDNAGKYTDPRGTIEVRVTPQDETVQVAVRDSGRGIRPEILPHVFDSFLRGDQHGIGSGGGLGIGLTLVKRLVELHGGTVTARSAGVAQGSEFIVTLPLQSTNSQMQGANPPAGLPSVPVRLRALVCDDNARAADTLGTLLKLWGYDVDVVYDGESAVDAVNARWPDIALLDLGLPGIDGYEVAVRLRSQRRPLLIVAITGHGQDEDRRRSREAGFDHHLVKPIDPPSLQTLLQTYSYQSAQQLNQSELLRRGA
jgi:signal transduction histidine kinase/CheY-like chemotaxis protein